MSRSLRIELFAAIRIIRAPETRSMGQFAEEEIEISTGPVQGHYSQDTQPYSRVLFALIASGRWNRFMVTGCVQSGKTLHGFVIPICYHLFELQEPVICLVPDGKMANKKWLEDLLPAIQKSRYRIYLPKRGAGSKGGAVTVVYFQNGTFLQFMTSKGDDKSRAGATARVVVMTELDGMDEAGEESRETDPISQCEARTESFEDRKRIYGECTVSIETGRTWQEYTKGTATRLVVKCCSCTAWVTPEREDLHGWQDAANEIEARQRTSFTCPDCGVLWTDDQRRQMLKVVKFLHRGQTIVNDEVTGPAPETMTLGFRWNAFFNLFWGTGFIGSKEWNASKSEDSDAAEKERLQFAWAKPFKPDAAAFVKVDAAMIMARTQPHKRGQIPSDTLYLSAATDLGMYWNHWVVLAFRAGATPHVVDYGSIEVRSPAIGVERATALSLLEFRDICEFGWEQADGSKRCPDKVFIDSGYQSPEVYRFCREYFAGRYYAAKGIGTAEDGTHQGSYHAPAKVGGDILLIHENYHIKQLSTGMLVEIDANEWKTWAHKRLTTPIGQPGAMTLFGRPSNKDDKTLTESEQARAVANMHTTFAKHLTAEECVEKFVPGKGLKKLWEKKHRNNHWFDALYYACVAGHLAGARLILAKPDEKPAPKPQTPTVIEVSKPFVRQIETRQSDGGWIRRRQ